MRTKSANKYLALGDSYTIAEGIPSIESYPAQATALLNECGMSFDFPDIIAKTGWTTADLLRGMDGYLFQQKYDIVSLLIGVNNQYQGRSELEYEAEFSKLLKRAIELAQGISQRVIVLSIPDYSATPFVQHINKRLILKKINRFNLINRKVSLAGRANYLNITGESRKSATDLTLLANDLLHYSGKEYAIWADLLAKKIRDLLRGDS